MLQKLQSIRLAFSKPLMIEREKTVILDALAVLVESTLSKSTYD